MKFFSNHKENLSVIDKLTKKRIALFENGEFETENENVIKKLKTKFRFESPKVISHLAAYNQLKKEAAKLGIDTKKMKKKEIEKALEESECHKDSKPVVRQEEE